MKETGIVRKVDNLGRIVIPMEIRKIFDIKIADPLEILVNDGTIVLRKYNIGCSNCGGEVILKYQNLALCKKCLESVKNI